MIDHFSKFAGNYVLTNKEADTDLNKIKNFISLYGTPEKILTDNGQNLLIINLKNIVKKRNYFNTWKNSASPNSGIRRKI